MSKAVKCPVCGKTFPGSGAGEAFVPGHSEQWKMCPGSYTKPQESK